jgi:hypothetical protein
LKILFQSLSYAEIRFCLFKFLVSLPLKLIGCSLEFLYLACLLLKGWFPKLARVLLSLSKISRPLEFLRFGLEYEYLSSRPPLRVEAQDFLLFQVCQNPLIVIQPGAKEINL